MLRTQNLIKFRAVLMSTNEKYSFDTLTLKRGNEEKIKYIVKAPFDFLKDQNYITENGVVQDKRGEYKKMALYLVLNADLPLLEEGLPGGVGKLVGTLPALPGPLLSALLRGLHMRPFLYEIVAFCRPALALQLADACIRDMQDDDLDWCLEHPVRLASALYRLTCRLHFARAPPAGAAAAALTALSSCLAHLDRPPFYRYLGSNWIFTLTLTLVESCYEHFTSVQQFEAYDFADIYRDTHEPDGLSPEALDFKICDSPNLEILESLRACNDLLLDHCAKLVMDVSVDTLCAWSDSTIKQIVGEKCYRLNAVLRSIPDAAGHRLVGMLEQISIRSFDLKNFTDVMNPEVIIAQIHSRNGIRAPWVTALLRWPDLCCQPVLLRLLRSEAATLDEDQSARLFDAMVLLLDNDTEGAALQRTVAIEAFRRCSDSTKNRILAEQFRFYFHDNLMTVDFEAALSETFGRLAAGEAGPGDVLAVFVQNPRRTLERMVRAAGDGAAQTERMLRVAERLGECHERRYNGQHDPALVRAVNSALDDAAAAEDDERCERLVRFVTSLRAYFAWQWLP